jgi:hypothetical protein
MFGLVKVNVQRYYSTFIYLSSNQPRTQPRRIFFFAKTMLNIIWSVCWHNPDFIIPNKNENKTLKKKKI